jgi:hypothetical protein
MSKKERREYHKRWRDETDRKKFLEGQRRRHRKWYYRDLDASREKAKIRARKCRADNPEKFRLYMRERWLIQSRRNRRFVDAYKQAMGCQDCGITNPVVLDFDHRRDKRSRVSSMRAQGWSLMTIIREIEKCEVRCANCHRIRHNTGEHRG